MELIVMMTNIHILQHFQRIYYLHLCCDFVTRLVNKTGTYLVLEQIP